jgi:hypothetical protein
MWDLEPVWTVWRKEFLPVGDRTQAVQPVACPYSCSYLLKTLRLSESHVFRMVLTVNIVCFPKQH